MLGCVTSTPPPGAPRRIVSGPADALVGTGALAVVVVLVVGAAARAGTDALTLVTAAGAAVFLLPRAGLSWLWAWRAGGASRAVLVVTGPLAAGAAVAAVAGEHVPWLFSAALVMLPAQAAWHAFRVTRALAPSSTSTASLALPALLVFGVGLLSALAGPPAPLVVRVAPAMPAALAGAALAVVLLAAVTARASLRLMLVVGATALFAVAGFVLPGLLDGSGVLEPVSAVDGPWAWARAASVSWLALAAQSRAASVEGRSFDPVAHVGLAFVLGAVVLVDAPWIASRVLDVDLPTALLAVEAAAVLQLTIVDVVAFRLSRPPLSRALLEDAPLAPADRGRVSNARALAFAVPGLLLASGVLVDVWQTWRVRPGAPEAALDAALALHPGEGRATLREAAAALADHDVDAARASLGVLAKTHAFAPAAERLRVEACVRSLDDNDVAGGARCASELSPWLLEDPVVVALSSTIALRQGSPGRALELGRRAVALRPDDPVTLTALGLAEAKLDEPAARAHLEEVVRLEGLRIGGDPLVEPALVEVGLALADVHRRAGNLDAAASILDRLEEGLGPDRPRDELRVRGARARIYDVANQAPEALDAYQRALRRAPEARLFADEVMLWADYAALLGRSGASPELRYACALKAKQAAARVAAGHVEKQHVDLVANGLVEAFEATLDAAIGERVRANLDSAVDAALSQAYAPPP
jgi:tetratricopeptide (TPR) repeat protein